MLLLLFLISDEFVSLLARGDSRFEFSLIFDVVVAVVAVAIVIVFCNFLLQR